jgi:hypothetical protein
VCSPVRAQIMSVDMGLDFSAAGTACSSQAIFPI